MKVLSRYKCIPKQLECPKLDQLRPVLKEKTHFNVFCIEVVYAFLCFYYKKDYTTDSDRYTGDAKNHTVSPTRLHRLKRKVHIDGTKFAIMGLDRAIRCGNDVSASVYDERGILFIWFLRIALVIQTSCGMVDLLSL